MNTMSIRKNAGIIACIIIAALLLLGGKGLYEVKEFNDGKDYSKKLKGRFVLKGAECAGFNFIDDKTTLWTNEMFCNDPDSLNIHWINATTFITKTTKRHDSLCPPRIDLYEVVSYNNKKLVLKSTWTGWGENGPDTLELIRVQ
jgi:hypothetical protein